MGPTGIGKTALSIAVAKHFNTEIISCDSRQFYKEMRIGTAVPSEEEIQEVKHHFIQHLSIHDNYSVGEYERDALLLIDELFRIYDVLVVVGGSGLYLKALLDGLDDFPDIDPVIREKLNRQFKEKGIASLQRQLKQLDALAYDQIEIDNPHRIIRALEVCLGSGRPYSSFLTSSKSHRSFKSIKIGLTAERNIIYERINQRVDMMMHAGLYEEAKKLYGSKKLNALNTVGYKELFDVMDGRLSIEQAVDEIKKNTRRFAKRQLTWNRKEDDIKWFNYNAPYNSITAYISGEIKKPA